jgi:hypothetical protein
MRSTPLALVLASSLLLVAANEPEAPPAITLTLDAVDVVRKPAGCRGSASCPEGARATRATSSSSTSCS